jgi:hypothetical protein
VPRLILLLVLLMLWTGHCHASPPDSDLYKKAEAGDAEAQYSLGFEYTTSKLGAPNGVQGVKWLTKAAEQGSARAQLYLSALYVNGDTPDIPKDWSKAYLWIRLAEKTHSKYPDLPGALHSDMMPDDFGIPKRITEIEMHLGADDIAKIKQWVDNWKPGRPIP